jgi:hypothetical protein
MGHPNPLPEDSQKPLPLFRAEAMAAQQQKFYGEILLIRPLSLTLFFWLGMGVSALVLGFLLLGSARERIRVTGIFQAQDGIPPHVELKVPLAAMKFVRVGDAIPVHCVSCPDQLAQTSIADISAMAKSASKPMCQITLVLPAAAVEQFPEGAKIEADVPAGKMPLLKWLFASRQ